MTKIEVTKIDIKDIKSPNDYRKAVETLTVETLQSLKDDGIDLTNEDEVKDNLEEIKDEIELKVTFSNLFGPWGQVDTTNDPTCEQLGRLVDLRTESDIEGRRYPSQEAKGRFDKKSDVPVRSLRYSIMRLVFDDVKDMVYDNIRSQIDNN